MFATTPSTVMILACSIEGWKCQIFTPHSSSRSYDDSPGELHEPLVRVRARQQDLDPHAAFGRRAQPLVQLRVRHEVRRHDPHPLLRELEEGQEQRRDVAPARLRRAADRTGPPSTRAGAVRGSGPRRRRTARRRPRASCRGTRPAGRPPPARGCGSACRATRDSSRASPSHSSAMPTPPVNPTASSTIITFRWVRWFIRPSWNRRERAEPPDPHAGLLHGVDHGRGRSGALPTSRASTRTRTPARARSESAFGELASPLAAPVDERQKVDACSPPTGSRRAWPGRSRRRCAGPRWRCPRSRGRRGSPRAHGGSGRSAPTAQGDGVRRSSGRHDACCTTGRLAVPAVGGLGLGLHDLLRRSAARRPRRARPRAAPTAPPRTGTPRT